MDAHATAVVTPTAAPDSATRTMDDRQLLEETVNRLREVEKQVRRGNVITGGLGILGLLWRIGVLFFAGAAAYYGWRINDGNKDGFDTHLTAVVHHPEVKSQGGEVAQKAYDERLKLTVGDALQAILVAVEHGDYQSGGAYEPGYANFGSYQNAPSRLDKTPLTCPAEVTCTNAGKGGAIKCGGGGPGVNYDRIQDMLNRIRGGGGVDPRTLAAELARQIHPTCPQPVCNTIVNAPRGTKGVKQTEETSGGAK